MAEWSVGHPFSYLPALNYHSFIRIRTFLSFLYFYCQFNKGRSSLAVGFFYGIFRLFLQYYMQIKSTYIQSNNVIQKVEACWIMYLSSNNVRIGQNLSRQVFKDENCNSQNFRIFRKSILRYLQNMMYTKYQFNRNARSMLNQSCTKVRIMWVKSRQLFKVENRNKKFPNFRIFRKASHSEPCDTDADQV